jgi:aspartate/methionine/tyrosine aminotransferase
MTGIRVGWVLSSNEKLIDNVRKCIAYNIMCANTPGQYGALAAVKYGMQWLHNCVVEYERRMEYAAKRLRQMGLLVHWPMGSFYLFPKHPFKTNIAEEILEESRVAVIDGVHFGEFGKSHFRISCCVREEVQIEGLNRLEGWFRKRLGDHTQTPTE